MTTDTLMVAEVDCSTGIQTNRPMTEAEIANMQSMQAESEARRAAEEAEATAKAEAKASAEAKLSALGLTPEEIAALR
jgi:regulator of protease activity HflC (stomatin/prohibitin superfamily)